MVKLFIHHFFGLILVFWCCGFGFAWSSAKTSLIRLKTLHIHAESPATDDAAERPSKYSFGLGKNKPLAGDLNENEEDVSTEVVSKNWMAPEAVEKPPGVSPKEGPPRTLKISKTPGAAAKLGPKVRTRKMIPRDEKSKHLRAAVWHEQHFNHEDRSDVFSQAEEMQVEAGQENVREQSDMTSGSGMIGSPPKPAVVYPNIDLSVPKTIYDADNAVDIVWDTLRYEAYIEAQREPLLVSFMYSTILNHQSLESALAFHLANLLSSPAMISTQVQALIFSALQNSPDFRQSLRADMLAVRDRDPACTCLPDVFLYFKGFHALQTHRVANYMYKTKQRHVLAHYFQSQVSRNFQIDIHPNATMGSGIMLDHGTGIVVGETATVGHNCSILHHVTLGGSGKKGVDRHPKVGNGVLLGAGASVLGNVQIGDGCQVGAGTLVISDLPPHSVAVGVPAKTIGSFVDVTEQPGLRMDQMTGTKDFDQSIVSYDFESGGI